MFQNENEDKHKRDGLLRIIYLAIRNQICGFKNNNKVPKARVGLIHDFLLTFNEI